jgi:hypothetical protein
MIVLGIALYLLIGIGYLVYKLNYDMLQELWSPIQPVGFFFLWPIVMIVDIIRYLAKNFK